MAHNFNHQTNIGLGESIKMGIKAPALADRIFNTWSDANIYIHDANSSAVNGLVLTVINDGNNNGGWFVDKRDIGGGEYELVLVRMGAGGGGSCDLLIPITYEALKNMRDTNQLTPGCRYRIIDYVTKANVDMYNMDWSQIDPSQLQYLSFSAEHPYDIIVLATDTNKLSEDAKAIQHEGDTYFSDSNLEAWELKYSLDNDLQYSWIQDPFNYGESILPPFQFSYISTKEGGQNPDFQNILWEDSYVYNSYNLCDNVPQWLEQQIAQFFSIDEQHGQEMSIEILDTYYVPYPDVTTYGMARISSWGLDPQVVYFNRISVLRITSADGVMEFPVFYDYDNPNVWHLEGEGEIAMDLGITFGTAWEIMDQKGGWQKVEVKNTGKIIVEVHGCKGVVFEMKDEFNNKADYDFKNIIYVTDYDSDGVYSFDLYIDSHNIPISIVIPDSVDDPTQVVDTYSDVTVNCIYDDWEGWHIPYYNEQQCFISYDNYLFKYVWYRYSGGYGQDNVYYIGYNRNGLIDTTTTIDDTVVREAMEYITNYASITQYRLDLYLDYTFSKSWNDEYPLGNDDDDNDKKGVNRETRKHTYKNIFANFPVKEHREIESGKIKSYLENVSEKRDKSKKGDEPRKRHSVLNRINYIRNSILKGNNSFESITNLLKSSPKKSVKAPSSSSGPVVSAWSSLDASLNVYDWENDENYVPIAVAENEVHGYVVNYAESQEDYSQIGCRTLPMIVMHAYPDYDFNYKSSITFNKVASDGYYGVTYIECYWFEGNKLFFPDFQYNYIYAASYNAIYNYWDEIASQIMGYPGQYGDEYWQQGDYRALNHRPDAIIIFEDSDGNELGGFNIGDDQQDDETIVIPTGGGVPPLQWRTLTMDEWNYLINTRSASTVNLVDNARYVKAQVNSVNGLILLPDVFTLPAGINMVNINASSAGFTGNIYTTAQWETLESAGCIFLPATGRRMLSSTTYIGLAANYWSSKWYPYSPQMYVYSLLIDESNVSSASIVEYTGGNPVRLINENELGAFSIGNNRKCSISKSNLQFHCLNKTWRLAPNAYDIIGQGNDNISEQYDGWIDLFGYGTSGWDSGVQSYQPWSTTGQFLQSYDLTGEYANADWGIYNMSYDSLATVAYTGTYNDLVKKPIKMIDGATSTAKDIVYCTQTEFDNLTPDVNTYYFIIPE